MYQVKKSNNYVTVSNINVIKLYTIVQIDYYSYKSWNKIVFNGNQVFLKNVPKLKKKTLKYKKKN